MNPAEARVLDSSRYPPHLSEAGFMAPCPRRIRATRDGATVIDSVSAVYVWEVPHYPAYYLPSNDVDASLIGLESTQTFESGPFVGLVHVGWDAVDSWFEEDEEVFGGHPRSPYARVDAIRSSRHIRVELDGIVLAETAAPVMLYLERSDTVTHCPYKGTTSDYWSATAGGKTHRDIAWSYAYPNVAVAAIAGLVAFYDERVDTFLDGVSVTRPRTKFHGEE